MKVSIAGFCFLGLLSTAALADDIQLSPDDKTAWRQSNEEFLTGEQPPSRNYWTITPNIQVSPGKDGLAITAQAPETGGSNITRYVPYEEGRPWLQFDIIDPANLEGYRAITISPHQLLEAFGRSIVGNLEAGRYVTRLLPGPGKEGTVVNEFLMRIDISGFQFVLKDFGMTADPLPRIEVKPVDESKTVPGIGDELKVTVTLAEPAEDVSVEMFNCYLMFRLEIGGAPSLQLTPEGGDTKVWSGVFKLEPTKVAPLAPGKMVNPGQFVFKATILGGNFPQPLLTWNEMPLDVNP